MKYILLAFIFINSYLFSYIKKIYIIRLPVLGTKIFILNISQFLLHIYYNVKLPVIIISIYYMIFLNLIKLFKYLKIAFSNIFFNE